MSVVSGPSTAPTPFVAILAPPHTVLKTYDHTCRPSQQPTPNDVPNIFIDSMIVREQVFVQEQGVPMEYEYDADDARSAHFVAYASQHQKLAEVRDPKTKSVILPAQTQTMSVPIGTIRLVPYPHQRHPEPGGVYVDGKLIATPDTDPGTKATEPIPIPGAQDRATTHHDGIEPYVKLGRLAVVKEFRGKGVGRLLVTEALRWIQDHPEHFNTASTRTPWRGLVCIHAQVQVVSTWQTMGFLVDEKMGEWMEEGIPHVGMFRRLTVEPVEWKEPTRVLSDGS